MCRTILFSVHRIQCRKYNGWGYSDYIYDPPAIITGAKYDLLVTADFNVEEHEITVCMELKIEGSDTLHTHTAVLDYSNLVSYYPDLVEYALAIPISACARGGYDGNNWEALTFGIGEEAPPELPDFPNRKNRKNRRNRRNRRSRRSPKATGANPEPQRRGRRTGGRHRNAHSAIGRKRRS